MRLVPWLCAVLLISCAFPLRLLAAEESQALASISDAGKPVRSRVIIITRDDCPRCEAVLADLRSSGGTFESLKSKGWSIGTTPASHIQIVKRDEVPELAKSLGDVDYPALAGIEGEEVLRFFKTGCTTPLDVWTFGWLATGKNERPLEAASEPALVETTGHYRLRGNHWSVEGDFNPSREKTLTHLRGPNHAASSSTYGAIDSWSLEELRSLHDDLHEREGGVSSGGGASSFSSRSSRPTYLLPKTLR